jgi:hypothetical protein
MDVPSDRLNSRLCLYGVGAVLAGTIIAVIGPPGRTERPNMPHPEDLWFTIPGWSIAGVGVLLLLYRIYRSARGLLRRPRS